MLPRDAPHRELFKSGLKIDFRAQEKKLHQNGSILPLGHLRVNPYRAELFGLQEKCCKIKTTHRYEDLRPDSESSRRELFKSVEFCPF